jgi:hypothetical protein
LKAITSAGSSGPYFAIKYFVPIYNYRTDKTICKGYSPGTSAQSISGLNLVSATDSSLNSQFEKIYRNGNYTLSPSQNFIFNDGITGVSVGATSNVTGSRLTLSTKVNTINGAPLSPIVSGSTISSNTSGNFTVTNTATATAVSFNPLSATSVPLSAFYRVTSYSPVSNGITSASGTFKCKIPAGNGSFKFNGLALYGAKVDSHGFDDNGNGISPYAVQPVLFAVALFDEAQTKQDSVGGVNDFEMKVNLGFDWTTYNTSGASPVYIETNYWSKMPIASTTSADALSYDGDIVLSSSAVPGSWTPRAKITIFDRDKQQMRLAKDLLHFSDFQIKTYAENGTSATGLDQDRTVLSIDTNCPGDSLLEVGRGVSATGIKSIALGCGAKAYGYGPEGTEPLNSGGYTTSIGIDTSAGGFASFAIGQGTISEGYGCFAGGFESVSLNDRPGTFTPKDYNGFNFSFGYKTSAISESVGCDNSVQYLSNIYSGHSQGANISMGQETFAKGSHTIALGYLTSAVGLGAVSIGRENLSDGCYSTTIGLHNVSKGVGSLAMGYGNYAVSTDVYNNPLVMAFGLETSSTGSLSLAMGARSKSSGVGSIAIGSYASEGAGFYSRATGKYSTALGATSATGDFSISIGLGNTASGECSIAMGSTTSATGRDSVSIGIENLASGLYSVALGYSNTATAQGSIALNTNNVVKGENSFVGGYHTSASGDYSIVFGEENEIFGDRAVVFGDSNKSTGTTSYTIGNNNTLAGNGAFSFGSFNKVNGNNSMAFGKNITINEDNRIVIGSPSVTTNIDGREITIGSGSTTNKITLDAKNIELKNWSGLKRYRIIASGSAPTRDFTFQIYEHSLETQMYSPTAYLKIYQDTIHGTSDPLDGSKYVGTLETCDIYLNPDNGKLMIVNYNVINDLPDLSVNKTYVKIASLTSGANRTVVFHLSDYVSEINCNNMRGDDSVALGVVFFTDSRVSTFVKNGYVYEKSLAYTIPTSMYCNLDGSSVLMINPPSPSPPGYQPDVVNTNVYGTPVKRLLHRYI